MAFSRKHRRLALTAAVSIATSLLVVAQPPNPAGAAPGHRFQPQLLPAMPDAPPRALAAAEDTGARLQRQAAAVAKPVWPSAASSVVLLTRPLRSASAADTVSLGADVGGLAITIDAPPPATTSTSSPQVTTPGAVRLDVLGRDAVTAAGRDGLILRLTKADGSTKAGRVSVSVGYRQFASAYGADYASRLSLVTLPECALKTPQAPACQPQPVAFRNDRAREQLVADVTIPATTTSSTGMAAADLTTAVAAPPSVLLASLAGPSSTGGDFKSTSLNPSYTWSAGGNTGDFTWSYPLQTPPSLGGPSPQVAFSYSAQSIDGLSSATNNQPSWLGDGFGYEPGFIERSYVPCKDDGLTGRTDECWATDNATLALASHGGELIQISTNPDIWRPVKDDGIRVQRLRDTSKNNGDDDGEYWKVTTLDGTQYYFGLNHLDGWSTTKPETNSVYTVPVYGNDANEPCNKTVYCQQAYRWNLDYVVDPHGNTMSYWYARETNRYARANTATAVSAYTRSGNLVRVDYGTDNRSGTDSTFTTAAPARINFALADRCSQTSGCSTHDAAHWPDIPWDQECTSTTNCSGHYWPTFWSTKRLSAVTTQVATGSATWKDVDRWDLKVSWLDPGQGDATRIMWLSSIVRTGLVGGSLAMPAITFNPTTAVMLNRVRYTDGNGAFNRFRLASIANESGGSMGISYSAADCVWGTKMPANPQTNTYRCYPAYWTPPGGSQILDYYNRFVVTGIGLVDNAGGSATETYQYTYPSDGAFWHYDDSELLPAARRTWNQWRGYEQVTEVHGAAGNPGEPQTQTVTKFFRGMNGDKLPSGTRSQSYTINANAYADENWLAGQVRETVAYNGSAIVSNVLREPWSAGPTATRNRNGIVTKAYAVATARVTTRTPRDNARSDLVTQVSTSYTDGTDGQPPGLPTLVNDLGNLDTTTDDTCTRTTYARNDTLFRYGLPAEIEVDATDCGTAPASSDQVISAVRSYYDSGTTFPTTPTKGEITKSEQLKTWSSIYASRVYVQMLRRDFDSYGRVRHTYDPADRVTTVDYIPATGGPVTQSTTKNSLNWTTTTDYEPAWGATVKTTDANNRVTERAYNPLGYVTGIWLPGWARTAHASMPSLSFGYTLRSSLGPTAVSSARLNPAGTAYLTSYQLFDGFLRPRQTQTMPATGSGRVLTDIFYDSHGRTAKTNAAYYATGTPGTTLYPLADSASVSQNRTSYDGAERPVAQALVSQSVEKWRTTTAYGGDRIDTTPPAGGTATSQVLDARGRTSRVLRYYNMTVTPWTPGTYDESVYAYDRASRLTGFTDAAGNRWTWHFDLLGDRDVTNDPDKGTSTVTYNTDGSIATVTDGRGKTIAFEYDGLGRRTGTWSTAVGSGGTRLAAWTYDATPDVSGTAGHPMYGLASSSTRYDSTGPYVISIDGYDAANRSTATTITIPQSVTGLAGSYTFGSTYNADDSVATSTLPAAGGLAAETLTRTYTATGLPRKLTGLSNYITETTYLQSGPVTSLSYNGGTTAYATFGYDAVSMRPSGRTLEAATTPSVLADVRYAYSDSGDVTSVSNRLAQYGGTDDTQCFGYDGQYLNRLTRAWTPTSYDCSVAPSTSTLSGPAPYWLSWKYDKAGNRTEQTRHTSGGDQVVSYAYDPSQPHGVDASTGARAADYGYDASGNTVSRPGTTAQQTLTWTDEGRLDNVNEGTQPVASYVYDAAGNRLLTRDATGTTLHLPGPMDVHVDAAGGNQTASRSYGFADQTVATRTTTGGLSWLFGDRNGTADIAVADATMTVTRRFQTPFGTARGTAATWPNQRGYVGGFAGHDDTVHLGARDLDPEIGSFLSVDPIFDTGTTPRYGYANHSPVTASDPSGLSPYCDEDPYGRCPSKPPTPPIAGPPGKTTTTTKTTCPFGPCVPNPCGAGSLGPLSIGYDAAACAAKRQEDWLDDQCGNWKGQWSSIWACRQAWLDYKRKVEEDKDAPDCGGRSQSDRCWDGVKNKVEVCYKYSYMNSPHCYYEAYVRVPVPDLLVEQQKQTNTGGGGGQGFVTVEVCFAICFSVTFSDDGSGSLSVGPFGFGFFVSPGIATATADQQGRVSVEACGGYGAASICGSAGLTTSGDAPFWIGVSGSVGVTPGGTGLGVSGGVSVQVWQW